MDALMIIVITGRPITTARFQALGLASICIFLVCVLQALCLQAIRSGLDLLIINDSLLLHPRFFFCASQLRAGLISKPYIG